MNLRVLYRDNHFIAFEKSPFMLVHRGIGKEKTVLVDLVKDYLKAETVYPLHRLDRQTSGVVLFARDSNCAKRAGELFSKQKVQKKYVALVRGITPDKGLIEHSIPVDEGGRRVHAVSKFVRIAWVDIEPREVSLVEVYPKTGRFHQVRRHMKHINHPLIGDSNYGKGVLNRAFKEKYGLNRLALHSMEMEFIHPFTHEGVKIVSLLPTDLSVPFKKMGFLL